MRLLRVQCRWAVVRDRRLSFACGARATARHGASTACSASEVDEIAAHRRDLDRSFYLPIEAFEHRASAYPRLPPVRNGRLAGVKMAVDDPLGAVAQLGERSAGSRKVRGSSPLSSISGMQPELGVAPTLDSVAGLFR